MHVNTVVCFEFQFPLTLWGVERQRAWQRGRNSCTSLMLRLKKCLRNDREVAFIINMDVVIYFSLGQVFHDSYHEYYCKSVILSLRYRIGLSRLIELCYGPYGWHVNHIYVRFEQNFSRLEYAIESYEVRTKRDRFDNISHAKWARPFFPNICFNIMNLVISHVIDS